LTSPISSTQGHDDDCTSAVVGYVEEIVDAIATKFPTRLPTVERDRWRRDANGVVKKVTVEEPFLAFALHDLNESLPSYAATAAKICADPDFGPLVGSLLGNQIRRSLFDAKTVIAHATQSILDGQGRPSFDRRAVSAEIAKLRAYVRAANHRSTLIIPLPGLTAPQFPVLLEEGLEFDLLTDEEVEAGLDCGLLRPPFPPLTFLEAIDCVGVRISISSPTVRTHPGDPEPRPARPHRFGVRSVSHFGELVEEVLFVLRLARPGLLANLGGVLITDDHMGSARTWTARATRPHGWQSYVLDEATVATVSALWRDLKATPPGGKRALPAICMRRFNAASDRVSLEDAVVDYIIAAEALFLRDVGSPDDRGELGYRLALRAGVLLEGGDRSRRNTVQFMRRAYDLRSVIAHGGPPPSVVKIAGDEVTISRFVDELGSLMRAALTKAVGLYVTDPTFGTAEYWDERILGPAVQETAEGP